MKSGGNTADKSRLYPAPGGIVLMLDVRARKRYCCLSVDGLIAVCRSLEAMRVHISMKGYFIELSACTRILSGGPGWRGWGAAGAGP